MNNENNNNSNQNVSIDTDIDKCNVLGIEFSINDILSKTIIDKYLSTLTQEDLDILYKGLNSALFDYKSIYDDEQGHMVSKKTLKTKVTIKDQYGYSKEEMTPLYKYLSSKVQEELCKDVTEKVTAITQTDEYKNKVDQMANEIIEYATEGWKNEVKESIRARFIGDVLNPQVFSYQSIGLNDVINGIMSQYIHC